MIITTADQIRKILPNVAIEVEYRDFETHIESAENWLKTDILGPTLYDQLDNGTITDEAFLSHVQKVDVLKAYEIGIPFMDLVQTSAGFGVVNDKNRAPASRQRVDRLIKQNHLRLSNETDWLLNFLEENSQYHSDWKPSPAYSLLHDCLIYSGRDFERNGSPITRAGFMKLKPDLMRLQAGLFKDQFSTAFITELLEAQAGHTLTTDQTEALRLMKLCMAPLSLASGLQNMSIVIDDSGVVKNYDIGKTSYANQESINTISKSYYKNGMMMIDRAVAYLEENIDSFTTYADSDERAVKQEAGWVNEEENPIFVFKGGIC